MYVHALEVHLGGAGVEVFAGYLALGAAVDCVGRVRAEELHVEALGAAPDLLVRGEADGQTGVGLAACLQLLYERHYLGDAGLVVRAEQGVAARDYERAPGEPGEVRELRDAQRAAVAELHVAAVVVGYQAGPDVFAGHVGEVSMCAIRPSVGLPSWPGVAGM